MTTRLEEAIKRLDAHAIDQLTTFAESLGGDPGPISARPAELTWVGSLRDAPERDGVEAESAAHARRMELLERGTPQ